MPREDQEVVKTLKEIYRCQFAGKKNQRFRISWNHLRKLYGLQKLHDSRVETLAEAAFEEGLYVFDLGMVENKRMLAVIPMKSVDRFREVTEKIIDEFLPSIDKGWGTGDDLDEDEDDDS